MQKKQSKGEMEAITIEAKKTIKIVKNPNVAKGVVQVHPEDFEDIVRIVKDSLGQYLSFYESSSKKYIKGA